MKMPVPPKASKRVISMEDNLMTPQEIAENGESYEFGTGPIHDWLVSVGHEGFVTGAPSGLDLVM
jgi:hypothetical protein